MTNSCAMTGVFAPSDRFARVAPRVVVLSSQYLLTVDLLKRSVLDAQRK